MVISDQEVELHFSQPLRQVVLMLSVLALTSVGTVVAAPRVMAVFTANLWLNGFILFVFLVGLISCFVQVFQLIKSVRWIEKFINTPDKGCKSPSVISSVSRFIKVTWCKHTNIELLISVNFRICFYEG